MLNIIWIVEVLMTDTFKVKKLAEELRKSQISSRQTMFQDAGAGEMPLNERPSLK